MTKRKLTKYEDDVRRNLRNPAEINPAQSPHKGIHTCSKGCKKQGCNRGLRDTIEEQNAQIESLKQDLLEKTAAVRQVAQDNKTETEATRIENARLKGEVERLTFDPMTYLDDQGEWMPRHIHLAAVERLKAEVERLTAFTTRTIIPNEQLQAEVERLTKAGDAMHTNIPKMVTSRITSDEAIGLYNDWIDAKEGKDAQ